MRKSLVSYRSESEVLYSRTGKPNAERLVPYYELYKLINNLEGSIIKCGISQDEAFSYFSFFKNKSPKKQPMVSFEKNPSVFETFEVDNQTVTLVKNKHQHITKNQIDLIKQGQKEDIEFMPGHLTDSIPEYLISNPELKIALLTIDLDDYENTLTAMQYLYPRLVSGGVLIVNNYFKKNGEAIAVEEYLRGKEVFMRHFSLEKGPHYILKD